MHVKLPGITNEGKNHGKVEEKSKKTQFSALWPRSRRTPPATPSYDGGKDAPYPRGIPTAEREATELVGRGARRRRGGGRATSLLRTKENSGNPFHYQKDNNDPPSPQKKKRRRGNKRYCPGCRRRGGGSKRGKGCQWKRNVRRVGAAGGKQCQSRKKKGPENSSFTEEGKKKGSSQDNRYRAR